MKKHSLFIVCFVSAILVPFSIFQVQAQITSQNRSTVSGFVFDSQRRPISQIPVELQNEVNSVIGRTRTDTSGRYFFRGLSQGRFSIRVLPLGTNYEEQTQDIEISGLGVQGRAVSDHIQKDFYLRLRRDSNGADSVTGTVFAQAIPENAQKTFEKAVSDLDNNRVEIGVEELKNALELFPTYFLALERLGLVYISQQKYENAREVLSKAVTVNPRSFNSWYGLSYANYALKQPGVAVEAAQKAISFNPNSVEAILLLGISLRQSKQFKEAEKTLKQAGKVAKGKSPDVHWNLALLYAHNLKRYKDAADELELYLKTQPNTENEENIRKLIKQFREKPDNN